MADAFKDVEVTLEVRVWYPGGRRREEVIRDQVLVDDLLACGNPGLVLVELLNLLERAKSEAVLREREEGL